LLEWRVILRPELQKSTGKIVRLLKFFVGVLLLPACAALTMTAWRLALHVSFAPNAMASPALWAFVGGYALWLAVFAVLPKPMRTYVLGHELTHAFWALMLGARVSGLKVRKTGGQVRTSKTNWFIALAPYFFPFYAMLFMAVFFLAYAIWDLGAYLWVLFFLVGLGWSFHITFTLMMLLAVKQPDVQSQGVVFSAVVIYGMNLLIMGLMMAALSRAVTFGALARSLGGDLGTAYGWTLDNLVALWHDAAAFVRHRQHH
jgi:membrane-associated HD superfamily phosphohydrolase